MNSDRTRSRDETYIPPHDAYTSIFPESWLDYAMTLTGVQIRSDARDEYTVPKLRALLAMESGPLHTEEVESAPVNGYRELIFMSYWRDGEKQGAWLSNPEVESFFNVPMEGDIGVWRESILAPIANLDPSGFKSRHEWGVGRYVKQEWERYHAYYGSMRDRMPNGRKLSIEGECSSLKKGDYKSSLKRVLKVDDLPNNLCFIRGIFGWKEADAHQREIFETEMLPVYYKGVEYLRDHPLESNCVSMRICSEVPTDTPNGLDADSLGWFTSLAELERWTHKHETHRAIYQKSAEIGAKFDFKVDLNLGHEVIVVPKGGCTTIYNNCHPGTGFLPYFPAS